jgi:hypothetical protein
VLDAWEIALDAWALITGGWAVDLPSDVMRVIIMGTLSGFVSLNLGPELLGSPSPSPSQGPVKKVRRLRRKTKRLRQTVFLP